MSLELRGNDTPDDDKPNERHGHGNSRSICDLTQHDTLLSWSEQRQRASTYRVRIESKPEACCLL